MLSDSVGSHRCLIVLFPETTSARREPRGAATELPVRGLTRGVVHDVGPASLVELVLRD
jgi:hypothetical protein